MGERTVVKVARTIDLVIGADNVASPDVVFPLDWDYACDLLEIGSNAKNPRPTRNAYRDWLGLEAGQPIADSAQFQRLSLMVQFCNHRHGRNFSRAAFLRLEEGFRQQGAASNAAILEKMSAYLAKTYNIHPHPLTSHDNPFSVKGRKGM